MSHHLIFEGAELAGKSWIMSQVYGHLEKNTIKAEIFWTVVIGLMPISAFLALLWVKM